MDDEGWSFRKGVSMTFGRGTRVKTKRPLMVSCPVKERVFRVIVGPGVTGTILEIIPNLRVRLDDVYEDKVQEIRWHSSARIGDDLVAIDEGERRLWVVK